MTRIVTEDSGETGTEEILASGATDIFSRAIAAFGSDPAGIKLQVFRMEHGEDDAWLDQFDFDPEIHDAEFLRRRFGPGKFRLKFRDRDYRYKMQNKISIAPRPGEEYPEVAPAVSSGSSGTANDRLLEILLSDRNRSDENFNKLVTGLLLRDSNGAGGGEAVTKLMEVMSAQNTALLQSLLQRPVPSGSSASETVLKALEAGLRVATEVKTESEGGWLGVVRSLAKDLAPMLSSVLAQQRAAVPPAPVVAPVNIPGPALPGSVPAPVVPPPAVEPPVTAAGPMPEDPDLVAATFEGFLKRTLPVIESWAKEGMTPADAAGEILDSVGVAYHPLFDKLSAADVLVLHPGLGSYKTHDGGSWLDQVLRLLQSRENWTEGSEGVTSD